MKAKLKSWIILLVLLAVCNSSGEGSEKKENMREEEKIGRYLYWESKRDRERGRKREREWEREREIEIQREREREIEIEKEGRLDKIEKNWR